MVKVAIGCGVGTPQLMSHRGAEAHLPREDLIRLDLPPFVLFLASGLQAQRGIARRLHYVLPQCYQSWIQVSLRGEFCIISKTISILFMG